MDNVHILFADDCKDTLAILSHLASNRGWNSTCVASAIELIDAVNLILESNTHVDAIVADINYFNQDTGPQVTGITAARQIRKALPDVPIVFISAYVTSLIREEVRRVNATIYEKPLDFTALMDRLEETIKWARAAASTAYTGEDRRKESVNRTDFTRRATDKKIETPTRIKEALIQTRSKHYERGQ